MDQGHAICIGIAPLPALKNNTLHTLMSKVYVVISVWHGQGRDRAFLHGVFENKWEAEDVVKSVERDQTYVEEEGYPLDEGEELSTYISEIPFDHRVNEFIPTVL